MGTGGQPGLPHCPMVPVRFSRGGRIQCDAPVGINWDDNRPVGNGDLDVQ